MEFLFPIELNNVFQRVENVSLSFGTFLQNKFFLEETVKLFFIDGMIEAQKKEMELTSCSWGKLKCSSGKFILFATFW